MLDQALTIASQLKTLEAEMLKAHGIDDTSRLIRLYQQAGELKEARGDVDAACFYFTHAYVFALEMGDPSSTQLLGHLVRHGRDAYPAN